MKVNRAHAKVIRSAIEHWNSTGLIDDRTSLSLQQDIEIQLFDWKRLAKYSFWISIFCIIISLGAVFADKFLLSLLELFFTSPLIVQFIGLTIISASIYIVGLKRRQKYPAKILSNEAIMFLGVLTTAGSIAILGRMLDTGSGHFSLLLLLSAIIYGVIGFFVKSNLIWLFSLISLGSWMGTETGYMSGWGAYYLGMNYPLRFVLFGGVLTGTAFALETRRWFDPHFRSTLIMGLLYLFIALWIMSIFGNYGDVNSWMKVKQIELFHWSLIFGIVACAAIFHGLRFENGVTKGFGITFLFINLYTRYFEYFWNSTHKAIFFGLLGVSFWFLGTKAEKIWNLSESKK